MWKLVFHSKQKPFLLNLTHHLACISRIHRDQADVEIAEPRHNWSGNTQRSYMIPKDTSNAMDELLMFARRMNNGKIINDNLWTL